MPHQPFRHPALPGLADVCLCARALIRRLMREEPAKYKILAWDRQQFARSVVTARLLPLRSGSDKPQICCLSPPKAGRSHPAAYLGGPPSPVSAAARVAAPADIPRAGGNPINPAVTRRVVVQPADRSPSLGGTVGCTYHYHRSLPVPAGLFKPPLALSRPLPLLSSHYHYCCYYRHCSFPQIFHEEIL